MHAQAIRSAGASADGRRPADLIRARHTLVVCGACGFEHLQRPQRVRESCPDCHAAEAAFSLNRDLTAR
jgi:rubrerythrin